jgi:hypothetical protein
VSVAGSDVATHAASGAEAHGAFAPAVDRFAAINAACHRV